MELRIVEYTVQIHRGNIMRKMKADSFATLVKLAGKLDLKQPRQLTGICSSPLVNSTRTDCEIHLTRFEVGVLARTIAVIDDARVLESLQKEGTST
jgi:hypothetical protein